MNKSGLNFSASEDVVAVTAYETLRVERLHEGAICRITLSRVDVRNAQDRRMLAELNHAFTAASHDDEVKVVILAADGPHFSSGHDLHDAQRWSCHPHDITGGFDAEPAGISRGFAKPGAEGYLAYEEEIYLGLCRRWYDLPKPTIAQVQGKAIAGGLMLMWVCDLIIASEDAMFADPTLKFGVNGVEWFAHPWELGPRKAKEMLFTGDFLTAVEARERGMVNQVVPREQLEAYTLKFATRITANSSFALKLAKMAVNQAVEAQGFGIAQKAAFNLHHLAHADIRERAARIDEAARS